MKWRFSFSFRDIFKWIEHRINFPVLFMVILVVIVAIYFGYHNRNKVAYVKICLLYIENRGFCGGFFMSNCFGFDLWSSEIGFKKSPASYSTNQMQNLKPAIAIDFFLLFSPACENTRAYCLLRLYDWNFFDFQLALTENWTAIIRLTKTQILSSGPVDSFASFVVSVRPRFCTISQTPRPWWRESRAPRTDRCWLSLRFKAIQWRELARIFTGK